MLSLDAGRSREGRVSPTLPLIAARKEILREHYALLTFANLLTIITRGTEQSFLFLSFQFFFLSLSLLRQRLLRANETRPSYESRRSNECTISRLVRRRTAFLRLPISISLSQQNIKWNKR